eukprot:TRINITY_DN25117_c0_g1_i1.p1 TRINITY_DN25117_c0_g1~~TRINITY_DN25117_c0_g1_i1.p1  ORF type:complete len:1220 (-),score=170.64 TRINITY_DN25117_c0_g1_i1:85-3744(-)
MDAAADAANASAVSNADAAAAAADTDTAPCVDPGVRANASALGTLLVRWWWNGGWTKSREQGIDDAIADLWRNQTRRPGRSVEFVVELAEVDRWERAAEDAEAAVRALLEITAEVAELGRRSTSDACQFEGKAHGMLRAWWSQDDRWGVSKWQGGSVDGVVSTLEHLRKDLMDSKARVRMQLQGPGLPKWEKCFDSPDNASLGFHHACAEAAERIAVVLAARSYRAASRMEKWHSYSAAHPELGELPAAEREYSTKCAECGIPVARYCDCCGLAMCKLHFTQKPWSMGPKAVERVPACSRCAEVALSHAASRSKYYVERAASCQKAFAGRLLRFACRPPASDSSDCHSCGVDFGMVAGVSFRPHQCCVCQRSLCSACLCGDYTCMGTPGRCVHKLNLNQVFGIDRVEKVCKDCLDLVTAKIAAALASEQFLSAVGKYMGHRERLVTFFKDPDKFPHYEQDYVDTGMHKLKRGTGLAAKGAKMLAPFLPGGWGIAANAAKAVYDYGQYGLLGLFLQSEIAESLRVLASFSSVLQEIGSRDLLVGGMYLSVDQRKALRDDPEKLHHEMQFAGQAPSRELLDALLGYAALGLHAPYQGSAFEAQRFALQQDWRLVTERLSESSQHRPAWCLYVQYQRRTAAIAIRGTQAHNSCGGDLFTDFNALPERVIGHDGAVLVAHSGMLAAAKQLETELWPSLQELSEEQYRVVIIGHSLGAGVAALLMWLCLRGRHSSWFKACNVEFFGIGYATPCVVDEATANAMKPQFVSVVNPVDVVPRLSFTTLTRLAREIRACARASKEHFDQDWHDQVDHALSVWRPRLRSGPRPSTTEIPNQEELAAAAPSEVDAAVARGHVADAAGNDNIDNNDKIVPPEQERSMSLELRVMACREGKTMKMPPGGVSNISRAWFGLEESKWRVEKDRGQLCTTEVQKLLQSDARFVVSAKSLDVDATLLASGQKVLLVELFTADIWTVRVDEGSQLLLPGGAPSIVRAWYGDPAFSWQTKADVGKLCTERIQDLVAGKGKIIVSNESLGFDPAPKRQKRLLVDVRHEAEESDLFCAGHVIAVYRYNGGLRAASVPCDTPSLRRIIFDRRLLIDHKGDSYHRALRNVRAAMDATRSVKWQGFAEAAEVCPCCHSDYAWMLTARSQKSRYAAMTNCRSCGLVVCTGCANVRCALPEQGILEPARVCDRCAFGPPDGGCAMWRLAEVFAAGASGAAAGRGL